MTETDTSENCAENIGELESAEDFFGYFSVPFDPAVLQVYRLHILQRFHDYLARHCGESPSRGDYHRWLRQAHDDFVASDAATEKVFRVFERASGIARVPLSALRRGGEG